MARERREGMRKQGRGRRAVESESESERASERERERKHNKRRTCYFHSRLGDALIVARNVRVDADHGVNLAVRVDSATSTLHVNVVDLRRDGLLVHKL
jgi:hypothetical protein